MHLAFDFPGEVWSPVLFTNNVVAVGVDVFSIKKETIHIEETGANAGESGARKSASLRSSTVNAHILRICHYHDRGFEAEARFPDN